MSPTLQLLSPGIQRRWRYWTTVIALLSIHSALLIWNAVHDSPTVYELGHLPAGLSHWQFGVFHLYRVNPPLPRMLAALPVLPVKPRTDWTNYRVDSLAREEGPTGIRFANANAETTLSLFIIARIATILFSVVGGLSCCLWARAAWGPISGLMALSVWCFSPAVLGSAHLVMPDVPAASLAVAAGYAVWRWLLAPTWRHSVTAGVLLGLAELCKTTLLLLVVLWPAFAVASWLVNWQRVRTQLRQRCVMLCSQLVIALIVLNAGYGFHASMIPLREFRFVSHAFGGVRTINESTGNRFADGIVGRIPVPVPRDYLYGIDRQRADFEATDLSYLRGQWRKGGWWYYHLYALAIKTPLGLGVILLCACRTAFVGCTRQEALAHFVMLAPSIAVVALVSSQTGFSNHTRYCIPALPFGIVWASQSVSRALWSPAIARLVVVCWAWAMGSSLWIYPHSMAYFNELVGGPLNGHYHLLDSNIACGQDLVRLRYWLNTRVEAQPLALGCVTWFHPRLLHMTTRFPAELCTTSDAPETTNRPESCQKATYYAFDVNFLHGTCWPAPDDQGGWRQLALDESVRKALLRSTPIARIGYSIYVYQMPTKD